MSEALRRVETLTRNGEKLAQEQLERTDREGEQRITRNRAELEEEQSAAGQEERIQSLAAEALDLGVFSPDAKQQNPPRLYEV
jgi:cell division protein FtsL